MTAGTHLIWSIKWSLWHRRSPDGRACGYTDDILKAGIFDTATAMAYHDAEPDTRDRAVPLAEARAQLEARIIEAEDTLETARRRLLAFTDIDGVVTE